MISGAARVGRGSWLVLVAVACSGEPATPDGPGPTADTAAPTVSDTAPPSRADAILALVGVAAAGAGPYETNCDYCHPAPGESGNYPPFETVVPARTDLQLVEATVDGYPSALGNMAAYGDDFTDQQIADLVAYMRETYSR